MSMDRESDRSATAMGLDDGRPWYLDATPLATLPWLIRLRWATACVEAVALLVGWSLPTFDFPLRRLAALIALSAFSNAATAVWLSRARALPSGLAAVGQLFDVLLLTGLLELTGGPFNPFSVIYAVEVALAALTLGSLYASGLGIFAAACYSILVYWHTTEPDPVHHRLNDFPTHLFAMWIAGAITAELAAYFIVQASHALAKREDELEDMRLQAARTERIVSMTTLAAGAAHELSTPLATIALASRELERSATADGGAPNLAADAKLIRTEVDRCRAILDQMSGRAGGLAPDDPEPVEISTVMADVRARLPAEQASRLEVHLPAAPQPVLLPRAGFGQAILSLVKNAFDATDGGATAVVVDVVQDPGRLQVVVRDHGRGITPDVLPRVGDPFFTTKPPGRGLGLGLFLARVFAERFGGALTVRSEDGTTAKLDLPTRPESMGTA